MKTKDILLIQFLMLGITLLFLCAGVWFIMWLFEVGNISKLETVSTWIGTYTGIMVILNILFNRFFKDI